jgi:hypothetical protein
MESGGEGEAQTPQKIPARMTCESHLGTRESVWRSTEDWRSRGQRRLTLKRPLSEQRRKQRRPFSEVKFKSRQAKKIEFRIKIHT